MPDLAPFHPVIVHFVVALGVVGVLLRWTSLTGKVPFAGPAATTLLLLAAAATVVAVSSGDQAHGPAERVPGARPAVQEHEEWGERTRNLFLVIAALEIAALVGRAARYRKGILAASGVLGAAGLFFIYEAGEHGGELTYGYAAGVGVRSGEPEDVDRLLLAALYHGAVRDREEGEAAGAAILLEEMARRFPGDVEVALLAAESLVLDRGDGAAALALLRRVPAVGEPPRTRLRRGLIMADAFAVAGFADSARSLLRTLEADYPTNAGIRDRLERLP